jgi:hypothetical protein
MSVYKLLGNEITISSANNVGSSNLVRVFCSSSAVITFAYANGTSYANTTMATSEVAIFAKGNTDTVAGSNMKATPIAYRN